MHALQILLVEDEQAIANTLIYALGSEGFAVCSGARSCRRIVIRRLT